MTESKRPQFLIKFDPTKNLWPYEVKVWDEKEATFLNVSYHKYLWQAESTVKDLVAKAGGFVKFYNKDGKEL